MRWYAWCKLVEKSRGQYSIELMKGDAVRMKLVAGLGNPGPQYAGTRHNLGFMVIDELGRQLGVPRSRARFRSEIAEGFIGGEKLILVKPQTFMNLSGHAVREAVNWYHADLDEMLIIIDDLALPFGTLRIRPSGSAGGHNGLQSVIEQIGSSAVPRLRIGIGHDEGATVARVLSRFSRDEERVLPAILEAARRCVTTWAEDGTTAAMNHCNRRHEEESAPPSTA